MAEHIFKEYDAELERVRSKVLEMGGLVENQIGDAVASLVNPDLVLAQAVVKKDHQVNALEVQIDEESSQIIARRQPAAGDLRMILMIIKTITDLERVGDEAAKIARFAISIHEANRAWTTKFSEIKSMAKVVQDMIRMALDAFARSDANKVNEIAKMDELVDEQYQSTIRQLITFMLEDPRTISMSLEVMFMAKALERIGDHAKNISEYVVYMVEGKDIRHIHDDHTE